MQNLFFKIIYKIYVFIIRILEKAKNYKYSSMCIAEGATFYKESNLVNVGEKEMIKIGVNTHIRGELMTFSRGGGIFIGEWCYVGVDSRIWACDSIRIGDRVLIAHNCNIYDNNTHPTNDIRRRLHYKNILCGKGYYDKDLNPKPIEIGDDVWIGSYCTILKGVKIGRGAIVASNSVVTKDVEEFSIVAGNPAKIVSRIKTHYNSVE